MQDNEFITAAPEKEGKLPEDVKPEKKKRKGIFVRLDSRNCEQTGKINTLAEIFDGTFPLYAYYIDEKKYELISNVNYNEPMINELRFIIGEENVVVRS